MTPRVRFLALGCLITLALAALPPAWAQSRKAPRKPAAPPASAPAPAAPPAAAAAGGAAAAAAAPASAAATPQPADYIVAVVNSEPITNNEVRARTARVLEQLQAQGLASAPPREQLMHDVLERLISERIQVQLAREAGIKADSWAVDQAERSVAQQNGVSIEGLHRQLAQDGISVAQFRQELQNQLLMLRIRERDVESRVKVSDADIDQFMQQQGTAAASAQALNLGHILIEVPENASPAEVQQRRERAQEVVTKLQAGGDFAALAREYSDAPEGRGGGEIGLRPADRYPELFLEATAKTAVGGFVGPVRSAAGFHILKVLERSRSGMPTVAVQTHARHILLNTGPKLSETQAAEQLAELRQRIERGQASFESLAREYSQDASASEGGDLGWSFPGRFVPEFQQALDQLQPGEVSQPVVTRFGVHLIELVERRQVQLTQRQQREMVREAVREKKLGEAYANWLREERARAYVELREPPR
ncbi:peptidylprolyl isomerase [Comamonas sp. NLF-1-9]|uniref:peptidylprolyl isomerase n=1 Tax=Comamonas sp. NLF-1-9 TaxID=2853163 RepID=UPI001C448EA4|nr:peptidylprolyl isomerase [Comamonas sp. NLF-1-9]QXL83970.1 peptidylprolyl isomerase [Comamonas sp. NLF-1-9]